MSTGVHTTRHNKGSTHKNKRIGRGPGSGHGKTAGRGLNGMWSRAGTHSKRGFEGGQMPLHRRMPKRGFSNDPFKKEHTVVNVGDFGRFEAGAKVGPAELISSGLIHKVAKHGLRILGDGKLERAIHVTAHYFTESAREKIVKAGGSAEVIVP